MKKIIVLSELEAQLKGREVFNRSQMQVHGASSNEEALRLHTHLHADLIITKLESRPGTLTGDQLSAQIRRDSALKDVSIVLACLPEHQEHCRRAKANAHVQLPISATELAATVARLLEIPQRQSYRVITNIKAEGKYNNLPIACQTINISSTGILIESEREFAKGDLIALSFYLPGLKHIKTEGEVVRIIKRISGAYQYGIKFANPSSDDMRALEEFVKTCS